MEPNRLSWVGASHIAPSASGGLHATLIATHVSSDEWGILLAMRLASSDGQVSDPLVSAIVPSYNHAAYVLDAVGSVLAQDLDRPFEVIVIDDGSSDGSQALLTERFGGRPDIRLELRSNHGVSATFNRGVELARGTWLAFCCSDDRWHRGHLKSALANLEADREALICFGSARIVDGRGELREDVRLFGCPSSRQPLASLLRYGNSLCFSAAVFKREDALRVGAFDPELGVLQDYDLWLKLLQRGSATYAPEASVDFRWDGTNASGTRSSERKRRDQVRILERALGGFPLLAQDTELRAHVTKRLANAHRRLTRRIGDRAEQKYHLRKAFELDGSSPFRYGLDMLKVYLSPLRRTGSRTRHRRIAAEPHRDRRTAPR